VGDLVADSSSEVKFVVVVEGIIQTEIQGHIVEITQGQYFGDRSMFASKGGGELLMLGKAVSITYVQTLEMVMKDFLEWFSAEQFEPYWKN